MTDFTAYLRLGVDSRDAVKAQKDLDGMARSADRSARQSDAFGRTASRAFALVASAVSAAKIVDYSNQWTDLNSRVLNATKSQANAAQVMDALAATARRTYSSLNQTAEAYLDNAMTLTELGYSTKRQIELSDSLNNALVVSGTKGQQAASVMDALSKAMAFGELRGDNFNTVIQSGGRVVQALADGMGVTTLALREMAQDGLLKTGVVVDALTSQMGRLREEAAEMPATIGDGFLLINNSLQQFVGRMSDVSGAGSSVADMLVGIADGIDSLSASLASGQGEQNIQAWVSQWEMAATRVTDAIDMTTNFIATSADGSGSFWSDAFLNMGSNITALVQIAAIEFASMVDYAMLYGGNVHRAFVAAFHAVAESAKTAGSVIWDNLNPISNSRDFMSEVAGAFTKPFDELTEKSKASADIIASSRQDSIGWIIAERDAVVGASRDMISEGQRLREEWEQNRGVFADTAAAVAGTVGSKNEHQPAIEKTIRALEEEVIALAAGEVAYVAYQLAMQGASEEQIRTAVAAKQAAIELRKSQAEAADVTNIDSLIDSVDELGGAWTRTGSIVADSLGTIADSLNDYSAQMSAIAKKEIELAKQREKYKDDPDKIAKISAAEKKLASERTSANLSSFGQIAGAASSMFKEQSKGREALNKAEQVFTAIEIALALKKAAANSLTAITSAFSAPFPVNFAAGAAMIGIMAGLGVFNGSGGSGSAPSAADIQASQGTGTVLGDADGKSESILNAFENYEDIALDQLSELRGIRDAMTGLSSGIAKLAVSLVSTNNFSGAEVSGLGTTLKNGSELWGGDISKVLKEADFLGIGDKALGSLFGSTKKKLTDSGLQIGAQELGDVLAGDLSVFYYNTIETTKKKLWGLSKKTSTSDELSGADAALAGQFDQIFTFIGAAVTESLDVLGIESASAIESFKINIGKISFKDLSGEEIQSELNAIFSQQADLIAEFVVPAMKDYQQIGEGLFETLTRVAKETATFNYYTQNLGLNFNATGLAAIAAQQAIAGFSGGMDKLGANLQSYYEEFFSDEERAANQMRLLSAEMQTLGFDAVPTSREAFRALVEGLDLSTEAGQKQFAAMIELSSVFAELVPATEAATESFGKLAQSAFDVVRNAVSAERERIQGIVSGATTAKQALDRSIAEEKKGVDEAYKLRMDQLQSLAAEERSIAQANANAQNEAQRALAQARVDSINNEKSAVEERIGGLRSLFDQLTDTAAELAPKTNAAILVTRRQAEMEIDTALRNAAAGRGLPTDGRLDSALQAVRDNPAENYSSAQEMAYATAVLQNKLTALAGFTETQISAEEKTLSILESQLVAAERSANSLQQFTASTVTQYDAMILAAKEQYDADVAGLNLISQNTQNQIDVLTGIDSRAASVEDALASFNQSLLAADFENAQEQYARLDGILENGQLQIDTLMNIDTGVASLRDAIDRFAEAVNSADQTRANQELLAEMRRTADELHRLREEQRVQALTQQSTLNETARNTRITANEAIA
jgi:tape measure domain-containing protein